MLSLFPLVCSKLGAIWFNAEVSATEVNTLISAAVPPVAPSEHNISAPAATIAMRFDDVWIKNPSHEISSYSITSSTLARSGETELQASSGLRQAPFECSEEARCFTSGDGAMIESER